MERARSWVELLEQLYEGSWNAELRRFRSPFAFRGLPDVTQIPDNSLTRLAAGHPDVATLERSMLRNFRKYAVQQMSSGVDSIWRWLAVTQHHGLPTRLVDWTFSPFVALHFATEHPDDYDRDGSVWCVDFVRANRLLPKRLGSILDEDRSETFTADMLAPFTTLSDFDALTHDPFLLFIEPPALECAHPESGRALFVDAVAHRLGADVGAVASGSRSARHRSG